MKKLIKILIFLLLASDALGQMTPVSSEYLFNSILINPACAGSAGALNIAALYRNQWVNIKGAPVIMTFSVDAPISNEKIGLGLLISVDKIGVTKETNFISSYSYKISIGDGNLAMGLSAGMTLATNTWSDLVVVDPGDEIYLANSRVYIIPNFSFGLYYTYHNFYVGFSLPKLLTSNFDYRKNKYELSFKPLQYNYLLTTGYVVNINNKIKLLPSALMNFVPGEKLQYDLNMQCSLINKFFIGTSYRNNRAFVGILQFQINNQFRIGYSYDLELGNLGNLSNGSHEIMLRYEFRYKVNAVSPLNL
jgi:type IX secretion system PorP/SprF family membrane protein